MRVRPAGAADARAVAALHNRMIRETLFTFTTIEKTETEVAAAIAARGEAFQVAEEQGGGILGFATYFVFRAGPGYAPSREHTVVLAPGAEGRGVGRALMGALETAARAEGIHVLVAGISSANPRAQAFHRSIGFVETGRMPEVAAKAGQRLDLVLMQKILNAPDSGSAFG